MVASENVFFYFSRLLFNKPAFAMEEISVIVPLVDVSHEQFSKTYI